MKLICQLLPAFCVFVMALGACKSNDVQKVTTYTVTNTTPYKVMFDIYNTRADYCANTGRESQHTIEPNASLNLELDALRTFWVDWYSDNYTVNNWMDTLQFSTDAVPNPKLPVAIENDRVSLRTSYRDTSRSVLLNGDGIASTWKVVVTNQPAINGTHLFTFRKDLQCIYKYTDANGGVIDRQFVFTINNSLKSTSYFRAFVRTDQNLQFATMEFNNPNNRTGRDTLLTTFVNTGTSINGQFPAVRQQ